MTRASAPMKRREFLKKAGAGSLALASLPAIGHALASPALANGPADHVRWDIISVNFPITTVSPNGVAFASAPDHAGPPIGVQTIRFTGSGTFVAPASGGTSEAVTGGGNWETFLGGVSTGSGTYQVTGLASWQFANFAPPGLIDLIGNTNERANGNAVLRIEYSDGSQGILGVGCHGPGAPDGIAEGVIATKGFVTYWTAGAPLPGVDLNRTLFHVRKQ